jgi:hypothetical protein
VDHEMVELMDILMFDGIGGRMIICYLGKELWKLSSLIVKMILSDKLMNGGI